jgi:hypothetical protein
MPMKNVRKKINKKHMKNTSNTANPNQKKNLVFGRQTILA